MSGVRRPADAACYRKQSLAGSLACLMLYAYAANTHAQAPGNPTTNTAGNASQPDVILETLEAIADSPYRTGDVISSESTSNHSRVERQTLERSADSLAAVLARETGIQHRQSGGFGSFSSVSIRAATGAQTDVYLDGVLLNNGGTPVVDLSTLEMLNLNAVDIYRGSTPLQLGHGAIGGAINLISLKNVTAPTTRLRLGIGSLDRREFQLSHQTVSGAWDWVAALSHRQSDNDFSFINDNRTPLNPDDDKLEQRNNADARRLSTLLRAGYQGSPDARTDLTIQLSARELGVPEWRNNPENIASYDTVDSQIQISQVLDSMGNWNSRHNLYWHGNDANYRDTLGQIGLGSQDTNSDTRTIGARTYWEYLANTGTLGLSLDVRNERFASSDELTESSAFSAERQSTHASIHYVWFDSSDNWSVTPALRWQHKQLSGSAANAAGEGTRRGSTSHTGAQIGIAFRPAGALSVTANAGSYYREPAFGELFGSSGLVDGNPELLPEKGFNLDVGLHYQRGTSKLSATVFGSEREELIVTAYDARGVGEPVNTGSARVIGLELTAGLSLSPELALQSNLTWQSPRSRDDAVGFNNRFLPGEALFVWSSRLQYQLGKSTVWYELDVHRKSFYDLGNNLPKADHDQHAVGLDWTHKNWQASLGISNISNDNVEDFNGFPKPGRTWSLSITRTLTSPNAQTKTKTEHQ